MMILALVMNISMPIFSICAMITVLWNLNRNYWQGFWEWQHKKHHTPARISDFFLKIPTNNSWTSRFYQLICRNFWRGWTILAGVRSLLCCHSQNPHQKLPLFWNTKEWRHSELGAILRLLKNALWYGPIRTLGEVEDLLLNKYPCSYHIRSPQPF